MHSEPGTVSLEDLSIDSDVNLERDILLPLAGGGKLFCFVLDDHWCQIVRFVNACGHRCFSPHMNVLEW